jgi:putative glutamine amidotransferase
MNAPPALPIPIVAVAADVKELDGYAWHAVVDIYLNAVSVGAGAIPVVLPSLKSGINVAAVLNRVDGLLLPGSRSNVHPTHYGEAAHERAEPYDALRDAATLPLIRAAVDHGVPLFAICRGIQELNVALGGSIIAEVHEHEGRHDHRAPVSEIQAERFAIRQPVHIVPGGTLANILGEDMIQVNSLHRQAIGRLAERLTVEATAPDGTIEAVSIKNASSFALGVQWHPEYWVETDEPSRKLFAAFGDALRAHALLRESAVPTIRA